MSLRPSHAALVVVSAVFLLAALTPATVTASAPLSFGPRTDFPAGAAPYSIVTGDLNGDGKLDLAVLDIDDNAVSVMLGDGFGSFGPRTSFPTGLSSIVLAIGDLNRDGSLDLAAVLYGENAVAVLLGNGDGTFQPKTNVGTGTSPVGVAIGDLNGDGRLDLVATNGGTNTVSVLLGNGDGTFQPKADFPTGNWPTSVAIADLNHDNKPDLAITNQYGNSVSVLLGDGAGNLGPNVEYPLGGLPWGAIAIEDLNGDGHRDLAVSLRFLGMVSVLLGDGDGGFGPGTDFGVGYELAGVAIGDLDGDGKPDLAVANSGDQWTPHNTVTVLLGDGTGGFGQQLDLLTGLEPISVVIADLDGDGRLDLATANAYSNDASVLLNTTVGTTVTPQPPATCITPAHPCVAVPMTIVRTDAAPLRGFSVTVTLSGDLALCPPNIVQGTYLNAVAGTHYEVVDNHDGSYTVDCAILGGTCGATAPTGTLFTVNVGSSAPTGTGAVTVTDVSLRDCDNATVEASAGLPTSIAIDNSPPAGITALAASQVKTGNGGDGTTYIDVTWPTVEAGTTTHVYRADYGHYPEYDDLGGAVPTTTPPGGIWTLAGDVTSGTTLRDEPPARGFWYYAATVEDPCGNVSAVSNMTTGTLDYHLGDVMAATECAGDNAVDFGDISFLGWHYGVASTNPLYVACLDVGPTTNRSVNARPTTDNKINFEDMMMFAVNYGTVSVTTQPVAAVASDAV